MAENQVLERRAARLMGTARCWSWRTETSAHVYRESQCIAAALGAAPA
jgi:hypothetical protein